MSTERGSRVARCNIGLELPFLAGWKSEWDKAGLLALRFDIPQLSYCLVDLSLLLRDIMASRHQGMGLEG